MITKQELQELTTKGKEHEAMLEKKRLEKLKIEVDKLQKRVEDHMRDSALKGRSECLYEIKEGRDVTDMLIQRFPEFYCERRRSDNGEYVIRISWE